MFENDEYIVLKHNYHVVYRYVTRNSYRRTWERIECTAYAKLYRKSDLAPPESKYSYNRQLYSGVGHIKRWSGRGRLTKGKVRSDCEKLGIIFNCKTGARNS